MNHRRRLIWSKLVASKAVLHIHRVLVSEALPDEVSIACFGRDGDQIEDLPSNILSTVIRRVTTNAMGVKIICQFPKGDLWVSLDRALVFPHCSV
jgi:hypothetical protein